VIGRNYWKERFGSDPAILGRTIRLFDRSVGIRGRAAVGYTGSSFHWRNRSRDRNQ
jgi:hypothetical protein